MFSVETPELAWQRYARSELADLMLSYSSKITFEKARQFYDFLCSILPHDFDWFKFCTRGIEIHDTYQDELKLFINLTENNGHHIWLTTTDSINKFIWRDENLRSIWEANNTPWAQHGLNRALKEYNRAVKI